MPWTSGDSDKLLKVIGSYYTDTQPMIGAEVGVLRGWLSAQLLKRFPNLFLYMIDPWVSRMIVDPNTGALRDYFHWPQSEYDKCKAVAGAVTDFAADRRELIPFTSADAAARFKPPLDWVFLDGSHTYESVAEDMDIWWPHVKMGGVFSGHDYGHPSNRTGKFGVDRAVNEFAEHRQLPVSTLGTCWWIVKTKRKLDYTKDWWKPSGA